MNPEDLSVVAQALDGEPAFIGLNPARPFLLIVSGGQNPTENWFSLFDTANGSRKPLPWLSPASESLLGTPGCAAPGVRRPRGFDVRRMPDGRWLLAVITDEGAGLQVTQRIEYVDLTRDPGGWVARWIGCVPAPAEYFLNDVAVAPNGRVFATHMYTRQAGWRGKLTRVKFFFGLDTGNAVMWDGAEGWRPVPQSEGSFPNGIAVDPTGSVVFVAYTYGARVARIDLLTGARADAALPLRPDNLTWTQDPSTNDQILVAAGATGLRMVSTWNCETQKPFCAFPFAVAAIDSRSLSVQTLYADDRHASPGASVAVKLGQTLYLGTAFGERMTIVPLN